MYGEGKAAKALFPLPELTGDRFPLPVNTGRVDGRAFPLAELTGHVNPGSPGRMAVKPTCVLYQVQWIIDEVMCWQKHLSSNDETWKLLLQHPVHRYTQLCLFIIFCLLVSLCLYVCSISQ